MVAGKSVKEALTFTENYSTMFLTHNTPLPIKLDYETPETLGVDRIAAAVGAQAINPDKVSMIIDAGTCITYDLIDGSGLFHGGIISPGIRLRYEAMHNYTGNLPMIEFDQSAEEEPYIGKSTIKAMKSGVINGIKGEMESFIDAYSKLFPDLRVIMCGGQAKFFESRLKASIFAVPKLVLTGLNRILEYNE
jgi:type III pantothenate kinase